MNTQQKPLHSGFHAASTSTEVMAGIDLQGKTAVVTGGYAGIGLETTRSLVAAGCRVLVPARDLAKARTNLNGLANVTIAPMELTDPDSIDAFATGLKGPLHLLINNAGIMWVGLQRDARGYESHFSTNHLGHFQLTRRLWPALLQANGARVINVSSWGHRFSPVVFEDWNFERRAYDPMAAYGQSKTANNLFTLELDRRGQTEGIRSFSLHPGAIVDTDLKRHAPAELLHTTGVYDAQGKAVRDPARGLKTIEQGAATTLWCATSPRLEGLGGLYCDNCDVAPLVLPDGENEFKTAEVARITGVMPHSIDPQAAARLWDLSEQLTRDR
ncbi:oxidoreductase [bacterium SCN 62-11]|nr:SDR family NAD(P)-dependent oxidoreductase [Candidatus Eremiobacteraeota bacterium]ODT63650.1 MAG: oxidoreductase [bacterium SCN 62-11]